MDRSTQQHSPTSQIDFLKTVLPFSQLSLPDLQVVARDFRVRTYQKHAVIFWQGDRSRELYLVRKGKVRVFKTTPAGNETSFNIFGAGDIIGELALLDRQPRSATAKAIGPCALWEIDEAAFIQHLRSLPDLALAMTRMLAAKLRWTAAFAETIAQYDAAGRLLHILLLYNEQFGEERIPGKEYLLDLALTQDDLASLVGARREWINRLLQEWRRKGLLEYRSGAIVFHDLAAIRQERDRRTESDPEI